MKSTNKLFETIISIFKTLEELVSRIISFALMLAVLAGFGAVLFMFYKIASVLLTADLLPG